MGKAILRGSNINGVVVYPLKQIVDERGSVMHMLRSDSPNYEQFGEIYFSTVKEGIVKAWKKHKEMTQNLAVPVGMVKIVIYDDRPESITKGNMLEINTGTDNYSLISIPINVWYGIQGLGKEYSLIANCASLPHDDNEVIVLDYSNSDIPYEWK